MNINTVTNGASVGAFIVSIFMLSDGPIDRAIYYMLLSICLRIPFLREK